MKRPCRALVLGAVLLAVSATAPAQARDELVIGVAHFPSGLHPDIDPEAVKAYVLGFAFRGLTAFDANWRNTCLLCAELPSLDNGLAKLETRPDGKPGMAVTLKLRPGLNWGDGEKLTTRDLAFTWRVGHDPASGFANTRIWGRVAGVEVIDDLTAVLHLDSVDAHFDRLPDLLPEHIERPIYERGGSVGEYIKQTAFDRAPTTPGLYNGPYRVTEFVTGQRIVLEPNAHWNGKPPGFKRIIIRAIENTSALQANLLSGDVDMSPGEGMGLTIDQVLTLRRQNPDRFNYVFRPGLAYSHIDVNLGNPILADLRVRRALLLALDRATMNQKLFDGLQPVADSWLSPLDPEHAADVRSYPYDPAQARALLEQVGWTDAPDGVRRNAKGERLSLVFATAAGSRLAELMQQVFQSQWKQIGVETVIRNEPPRTFFGETLSHREFQGLAMYSWILDISGPPRQMLGSDQIPTQANNWSGGNYVGFSDPRMDADIATAETELDPTRRHAAFIEMQQIYADQLPVLPLFFRTEPYVLPKWLKGVTPTGHVDFSSLWAEDWYSE